MVNLGVACLVMLVTCRGSRAEGNRRGRLHPKERRVNVRKAQPWRPLALAINKTMAHEEPLHGQAEKPATKTVKLALAADLTALRAGGRIRPLGARGGGLSAATYPTS